MKLLRIPKERVPVLLKNEKKPLKEVENLLHTKIGVRTSGEVEIIGKDPLEELTAHNIIKAVGRGFSLKRALKLLEDGSGLYVINIMDFVNTKNSMIRLKGRIIGKKGRIRAFLERELNVELCVYGKTISILGQYNNIEVAKQIIELLLNGGSYGSMRKLISKNLEKIG